MRRSFLLLSVGMFASAMASAQSSNPDITGIWLGTLQAGPQALRIQLHLGMDSSGGRTCSLDSIDQHAFGIACTVLVDASHIAVQVPAVGGSWSGQLDSAKDTLTGNWSQGVALPLALTRQSTAIAAPPAA